MAFSYRFLSRGLMLLSCFAGGSKCSEKVVELPMKDDSLSLKALSVTSVDDAPILACGEHSITFFMQPR